MRIKRIFSLINKKIIRRKKRQKGVTIVRSKKISKIIPIVASIVLTMVCFYFRINLFIHTGMHVATFFLLAISVASLCIIEKNHPNQYIIEEWYDNVALAALSSILFSMGCIYVITYDLLGMPVTSPLSSLWIGLGAWMVFCMGAAFREMVDWTESNRREKERK